MSLSEKIYWKLMIIYSFIYFSLRKRLKWKKINNIYLNISSDVLSKKVCENIICGEYEKEENRILGETVDKNDKVLELGTGLGFNSIFCSKINNGNVLSFEGNPTLIPLIQENMKKNKSYFSLRNEILSAKNSNKHTIQFNIAEDFWSSSLKEGIPSKIKKTVQIPVTSLDAVLEEFEPTYLLIDIEGGEEEFFENCNFLEKSTIKKILIELHPDIIGETQCSIIIKNIINKGFALRMDSYQKNIVYLYR